MGPGIALSFALAGYEVTLSGRRKVVLEDAMGSMAASAGVMIENGLLAPGDWRAARDRVATEVGFASAAPTSTWILEAIVEDLAAKRSLFAELERLVPPEAVLASTTSALSPTEMQSGLARPDRLVVTHYAQPAHLMPVVEVVPEIRPHKRWWSAPAPY
jgi:3-hydroxybutyryl-CoA dehydrogenase